MDSYYFKELAGQELLFQLEQAFVVRTDVTNTKQLSDLMDQEQNIDVPEQDLQWKCWFMPNFENGQSACLMRIHHVMGDGLGLMGVFATLEDVYNPDQFTQTTAVISTCKKICLVLLKPFLAMYAFVWFLLWPTDNNYIKGPVVSLDSKKKNALCKPFSVRKLKQVAKQHGSTINDVVLALVSVATK